MSIKALQEYIALSISLRMWREVLRARHGVVRNETRRNHEAMMSEAVP